MSKELYMAAHEELVEKYMDEHPGVDWSTAYERTTDAAYEHMRDKCAAMVDEARDRAKYK